MSEKDSWRVRDVKDDGGGGGGGSREVERRHWYTDCGLSGKLPALWPGAKQTRSHALFFPLTSAPFSQLHALWSPACVFSQVLLKLLIHLTSYNAQNLSSPKTYRWTLTLYISDPTRRLHKSSNTHIGMHVRGWDIAFVLIYIVYNGIFPFLSAVTLPNFAIFMWIWDLDFYCGIK